MSKGQILAYRRDRLGGRLRSMVNAMRLAQWGGVELRILWPVGHYAQELADPTEFLDSDFVQAHFVRDEQEIKILYDSATHLSEFANYREMRTHLNAGKNIVIENTKLPIALPKESQKKANQAFIETAELIPPSTQVTQSLSQFDKLVGDRKATALHVRRGDIIEPGRWSRSYWPTKYVPDDYYDVMIEADPEAAFLLFSDTPATLARFEAVHGIRSAVDVLGLTELTPSQRDFAELLAIAQCQTVLAASDSAFSTAATLLGGVTKLSLPDDMTHDQRFEAEQRLLSRVQGGPEAFLNQYDFGQSAHRATEILRAGGQDQPARAIVKYAAEQGLEVPHLTRDYLESAIAENDDLTALTIVAGEQNVRKVRRWHVDNPGLLKHHLRRQVIASFAYAGLGRRDLAAKTVSNLALCQTKISPLDILSVQLSDQLTSGADGVPPATPIEFGADQTHPRGLPSLAGFVPHWVDRNLSDDAPWNWQAAFDLDWRSIGVNARPGPREPVLTHIFEAGRSSADPMQVSLAAMAALRLGQDTRAKRLMAKSERMPGPDQTLKQAIMLLRRAQIAERAENLDIAQKVQQEALELSEHPAIIAYYLAYLSRHKQRGLAREIVAECDDRPFYLSWLRYELLARGTKGAWDREELGQECLDHLTIQVPDAAVVQMPARVA